MQIEMVPIGERTRGKDRGSKIAARVRELASASASGFAEKGLVVVRSLMLLRFAKTTWRRSRPDAGEPRKKENSEKILTAGPG
jgi:hypothetical protein